MDRDVLIATLANEVASYVWDQPDSKGYFLKDDERKMFAAFIVPVANPQDSVVIVAAHVEGDKVIIDTDLTDRPLRKALLQDGVPIQQIAHLTGTTSRAAPSPSERRA
jgi:hypothetical protein